MLTPDHPEPEDPIRSGLKACAARLLGAAVILAVWAGAGGTAFADPDALPTVTSITPASAVNNGTATAVSVVGTNFDGADLTVTLKKAGQTSISATSVVVTGTTQIRCDLPITNAATGAWNVVVQTAPGSGTLTGGFTVLPGVPTVTAVSPTFASDNNAAVAVTLTGTNFDSSGLAVTLQKTGQTAITATGVTVVSSTSITCTFNVSGGAAKDGDWNVVVATSGGTGTKTNGFRVVQAVFSTPAVTAISPTSGSNTNTNLSAVITGTSFAATTVAVQLQKTGQTAVTATNVVVTASTNITCSFDINGAPTGAWNVAVIATASTGSQNTGTLANGFTVTATTAVAPTVTAISPTSGSNNNTAVAATLTGTNFDVSGLSIQLQKTGQTAITATGVTVVSSTSITCTFNTNGAAMGDWDVVVATSGGTGTKTNGFRVVAATTLTPTVTAISPTSASDNNAAVAATLTGTNFATPTATVTLTKTGATTITATSVVVTASTNITCNFSVNGVATGDWNVLVTNTSGTGTFTNGFRVVTATTVVAPTVTSISPTSSSNVSTLTGVSVVGTGLDVANLVVTLTSSTQTTITATNVVVTGSTNITCSLPLNGVPTGLRNLVVTTAGGTATSNAAFTVNAGTLPTLGAGAVSPSSGPNNATLTAVSLVGTNFDPFQLVVTLTSSGQTTITATSVVLTGTTQITCNFPITNAAIGTWNVVVTTSASASATLSNGFTVTAAPPTLTSIAPATAPTATTSVSTTILGANFDLFQLSIQLQKTGQTAITATNVALTATSMTCDFTLIGAATGDWNLVVRTSNPTAATLANAFRVTAAVQVAPTVTSITPASGANNATLTSVSVVGTNFDSTGLTVQLTKTGLSSITATSVVVASATQINCSLPLTAVSGGDWNVVVDTDTGAAATLANGFRVVQAAPAAPTVASISPATATDAGIITAVSIVGTAFDATTVAVQLQKTGQTAVTATAVVVASTSNITCTFDLTAKATGDWNVAVITSGGGGGTATLTNGFRVTAAVPLTPTVTSMTPNSGVNSATLTAVSLVGTNFDGASLSVTLTSNSPTAVTLIATSVVLTSATNITCDFPITGARTGTWNLVVSTGGGSVTKDNFFTMNAAAPVLTAISPVSALNSNAALAATITGTSMDAFQLVVKLTKTGSSDITATSVVLTGTTSIACNFNLSTGSNGGAAAPGAWNVALTDSGGSSTLANGFQVNAASPSAPVLTSVTPSSGLNNATLTAVSLVGTNFDGVGLGVTLRKGGQTAITATSVVFVSSTLITCNFPITGAATGTWNVEVVNSVDNSTLVNAFTVNAASPGLPTVTSVTPTSGSNNGTVSITNLAGTNFDGSGLSVQLTKSGQTAITATSVVMVNATKITCNFDLANKVTGVWNAVVSTTAGGTSTATSNFTVNAATAPVVTAINPTSASNGSTAVSATVTGTSFDAYLLAVKLTKTGSSDITATSVVLTGTTSIACNFSVNGATTGLWNVAVTTSGGTNTLSNAFTVSAATAPVVTAISPTSGVNTNASLAATVTGTSFDAYLLAVKLTKTGSSDITATGVVLTGTTSIACTFNLSTGSNGGAAATGDWNVVVSDSASASGTLANGFRVVVATPGAPTLASITPSTGANTGAVAVTDLAGTNFDATNVVVKLTKTGSSDVTATGVVVVSSTKITCDFNLLTGSNGGAAATGTWSVVVTTSAGTATLSNAFTVTASTPVLASISPASALDNASASATLTGTNFDSTGLGVTLQKSGQTTLTATNVVLTGTTSVACTLPISGAATGVWDVVLATSGGSSTLTSGLTINAASPGLPTVTSITPSNGTNTGTVTITNLAGTNLDGASLVVKLTKTGSSDITATTVVLVSSTKITCGFDLTNKATGDWNVAVTTSGGTGTLSNGFRVTAASPGVPTVTSVSPSTGTNGGSVSVTLSGTNFDGPTLGVALQKSGQTSVSGTSVVMSTSQILTCSLPLSGVATGDWNVFVTTTAGSGILTNGFRVTAASPGVPTVTTVSPSTGVTATTSVSVTVTGTNFDGPTLGVALQKTGQTSVSGTSVVLTSSTQITCNLSLIGVATGDWNVFVTTTAGSGILANGFRVTAAAPGAPTLSSITPSTGANTGTVAITDLAGTGLDGASLAVKLTKTGSSDITATGVVLVSSTKITCDFNLLTGSNGGAAATGTWSVVVTTSAGTATLSGAFTVTLALATVDLLTDAAFRESASGAVETPPILVTDGGPNFTAASGLRLIIPATVPMTWDTSVTTGLNVQVSGTGALATTASYPTDHVAVLTVSTGFGAGARAVVTGLRFRNWTAGQTATQLGLSWTGTNTVGASANQVFTIGSVTRATISSANHACFASGTATPALPAVTITEASGAATITAASGIRICIPNATDFGTAPQWDTGMTSLTITGAASAKVSSTLAAASFQNGNRTLVLTVSSNLAAGDAITVSGLRFATPSGAYSADSLQLVVDGVNAPALTDVVAVDDKVFLISPPHLQATSVPTIAANAVNADIGTLVITDTSGIITAGSDIRLMIASTSSTGGGSTGRDNLSWSVATPTYGGTAAAKVAPGAVSVTDTGSGAGNRLVLINVNSDFAAGDTLTISGLQANNATATATKLYVGLVVDGAANNILAAAYGRVAGMPTEQNTIAGSATAAVEETVGGGGCFLRASGGGPGRSGLLMAGILAALAAAGALILASLRVKR